MIKVAIDYDLAGYAYDPDNPTREAEKLCYKLNTILDNLKSEGAELRLVEAQDITDMESYAFGLYEEYKTPPEELPVIETPSNEDMLLDTRLYNAITALRTAWLGKISEKVDGVDETTQMAEIIDVLKLMLNQETILYLSDGTPIYGKTGAIA
jgi:hypothetical protein